MRTERFQVESNNTIQPNYKGRSTFFLKILSVWQALRKCWLNACKIHHTREHELQKQSVTVRLFKVPRPFLGDCHHWAHHRSRPRMKDYLTLSRKEAARKPTYRKMETSVRGSSSSFPLFYISLFFYIALFSVFLYFFYISLFSAFLYFSWKNSQQIQNHPLIG